MSKIGKMQRYGVSLSALSSAMALSFALLAGGAIIAAAADLPQVDGPAPAVVTTKKTVVTTQKAAVPQSVQEVVPKPAEVLEIARSDQEGEPPPACFLRPAKLDDIVVRDFLNEPVTLLASFPEAGIPMVSKVRALAGSDSRTVDPLLELVPVASPAQRAAIGAGLARAAYACAVSNAEYSAWIQERVAARDNPDLLASFVAAAGDITTASLGIIPGGRPGSVPGINGVGGPGTGTRGILGDGGVRQTVDTYIFTRRSPLFAPIRDGGDISSVINIPISD